MIPSHFLTVQDASVWFGDRLPVIAQITRTHPTACQSWMPEHDKCQQTKVVLSAVSHQLLKQLDYPRCAVDNAQ